MDSIEATIDNAQVHVELGAEQLRRAAGYQKKSRKKMFILGMVGFIVLVIVGTILFGIW